MLTLNGCAHMCVSIESKIGKQITSKTRGANLSRQTQAESLLADSACQVPTVQKQCDSLVKFHVLHLII